MEEEGTRHVAGRFVTQYAVRAALDRILADKEFRGSERHRKLLRYVVDEFYAGRSGKIKAYSIAVDVFGRPASFDPDADPIVRVEAARLRAALAQYYETAGDKVGLRIELAKGNYVPTFLKIGHPPDLSQFAADLTQVPSEHVRKARIDLAIARPKHTAPCLIALAVAGVAALAGALYLCAVERVPWQPTLSVKPTITVDIRADSAVGEEDQRKIETYLVHALSRFSPVRALARSPAIGVDTQSVIGWVGSQTPLKLQGSHEYRISVKYTADVKKSQAAWQVVDAQSNEVLRTGISEAHSDDDNGQAVQEKLLARLARSLAGEEGVIVSLEAARQLMSPTIGVGCVHLADVALARIDSEGLTTAKTCLEQSLTYRDDADVVASLAMVLAATRGPGASPAVVARAVRLADKAVALAPTSSRSYVARMHARFIAGDRETAYLSGRRAAALNPLDDAIPARLGLLLFVSGHYSEGVRLAHAAKAISGYLHHDAALTLALEDYRNGKYREALEGAGQLANPADTAVNLLRAAASGQIGLAREVRRNNGGSTTPLESELVLSRSPALIALLDDGLAKAAVRFVNPR
ncbi:hypothetical protein [Ensifer sp.]|uniref:tetratricopeptide repeat protein n=1 Tax=Ensifer sp. TaxID=1872086 RepID=UPI00289B227A|nr:hypothetical protein [Ensifer sp.]